MKLPPIRIRPPRGPLKKSLRLCRGMEFLGPPLQV